MTELVPLIPGISSSDAERYYRGTFVLVQLNDKLSPFIFLRKEGSTAELQVNGDRTTAVPYSSVLRCNIPPFYDKRGNFIGIHVQRSTRRGLEVPYSLFPDLLSMVTTGDVQRTDNRLSKDFFIRTGEYLPVLEYQTQTVGFLRAGVWYVQDDSIKDRLLKLGVEDELVSVITQQVSG